MSGYTITKKQKFDTSSFLIMVSLIIFLSVIIIPFVAIYSYQDIFINTGEVWLFSTLNKNYFIFAGALIWFSLLIIAYLIYRNSRLMNDKKVYIFPFILLGVPGVMTIIMSLNYYFYMNDNGIYHSSFTSLTVEEYKWEEVVEAQQLQVIKNRVMVEGDLVFTFENGDTFNLPVTKEVQLNKRRIYTALRKHDIEVSRVIVGETE